MKYSVITSNKDKTQYNNKKCHDEFININIFNQLDNHITYTRDHEDADFTILPITWEGPKYEFDPEFITQSKTIKNLIILDYCEYGWETLKVIKYNNTPLFFGIKHESYNTVFNQWPEWEKLHVAIKNQFYDTGKIKLYFQRELSSTFDTTPFNIPVLPCDYCNLYPPIEPVSEEEFNDRNIDLLHLWGRSSTDRLIMHGNLMLNPQNHNNHIYTSYDQYNKHIKVNNIKKCILLLHREYFERVNFIDLCNDSKGVIDMYGAGKKCFRNIESLNNNVSFKQDTTGLKHAYEYIHDVNCVQLPNIPETNQIDLEGSYNTILEYLNPDNHKKLYDIYIKSNSLYNCYHAPNYIRDYILPNIISNIQ